MRLLIPHLVFIAMAVTSVVMLLFAEKIQQSAIRADRLNPFKSWARSRAYTWWLKITGTFIIIFVLCLGVFHHISNNWTGAQTISVFA
jgi:hypothetical protein